MYLFKNVVSEILDNIGTYVTCIWISTNQITHLLLKTRNFGGKGDIGLNPLNVYPQIPEKVCP